MKSIVHLKALLEECGLRLIKTENNKKNMGKTEELVLFEALSKQPDLSFPGVYDGQLLDITKPEHGVEVQIREDGAVVWVNVDGICRFRACQIHYLQFEPSVEMRKDIGNGRSHWTPEKVKPDCPKCRRPMQKLEGATHRTHGCDHCKEMFTVEKS